MTYEELKAKLLKEEYVPDYYEQLLIHAEPILADIAKRGQTSVAQDLMITQPKMSITKQMLHAHYNLTKSK